MFGIIPYSNRVQFPLSDISRSLLMKDAASAADDFWTSLTYSIVVFFLLNFQRGKYF